MYSIMPSVNSKSFTSYFPIWSPFISLSSLIAMARTFKTMLNDSGRCGYPCPVPDLQGNSFSFTSLRIIFAVGLSYMGASLVAQLVKNLPAMRETWIQSLGWGDPLEKRKATHSSILAWRIHGLYSPWGHKESNTTEGLSLSLLS